MFTGSYFNSVDEKSRVFIPKKFRYSLGERVWLSKGFDTCLYIFTQDSWPGFIDGYVKNRTLTDVKARKLQRFFMGGSHELEIDGQGRIKLPQDHIDYTGIGKDAVFVGCDDLIELWGAEAYAKEMDKENLDPSELMSKATFKAHSREAGPGNTDPKELMSSAAPASEGNSGAALVADGE